MLATDRIPLVDAKLEFTQHLTGEERAELANVSMPAVTVDRGRLDLDALLTRHRAFGATVLDGLVMGSLIVGEQTGIHLLGPGDLLVPKAELWAGWLSDVQLRTAAPVRLGLFGNDLLAAVYRWPRLLEGLYSALGEQMQRLNAQLVICQLPRVEDRVMAMLWLLAESWGHVTPGGVQLPLALTHETIGALIGARRPTVSLALRKLTDDGALVTQHSGWLLLQPPPQPRADTSKVVPVEPSELSVGRWSYGAAPAPAPPLAHEPSISYAELRDTVRRLGAQHLVEAEHTREQLDRARSNRIRMAAMRTRIAQDAVRRRRPPSS
jgi:CRP/FNR family transcriptional regulator, cyclic AMP receptor protein